MSATALSPLNTEPLAEYRVACEVEAHDGRHRVWLVVLATDEDDATDQALDILDHGCIADVVQMRKKAA